MDNLETDISLHLEDKDKFLIEHSININHFFYCNMADTIERSTRCVNFSTAIIQLPTWENGIIFPSTFSTLHIRNLLLSNKYPIRLSKLMFSHLY